MKAAWLGIVAGLLFAGCAQPASPANQDLGSVDDGPASGWRLEATECIEGGGHSVHPKLEGYLPAPWQMADVQDDTGTPPFTTEPYAHPTEPVPRENDTMGNWHVTVLCSASQLDGRPIVDHVFGYVGMRVEAPPFDDGPPVERHYLVTVVASSDGALRDDLHALGIHATGAGGHVGILDNGLFHQVLDTDDHGVYETYFDPRPAGPMPASYRLWFQADNGDGTFSPVALDVENSGGQRLRPAHWYGTFTHMETADHAPLPGAGGESPAVAYTGFDRSIVPGPAPRVLLDEAYIHS